jgi:hypothetical protein
LYYHVSPAETTQPPSSEPAPAGWAITVVDEGTVRDAGYPIDVTIRRPVLSGPDPAVVTEFEARV